MTTTPRRRLVTILKVVVQITLGFGIVAFLVWRNRTELVQLWQQPKRWSFLVPGFVLCLGATLITFVRWYVLIWAQSLPFRLRDALRIGFIGYLFNQIIPGAVSGDLVKTVLLAREQSRRTVAISTVIIDRIVGVYGLALVAGMATLLFWRQVSEVPVLRTLGAWIGVMVGAGAVVFALLLSPVIYRGGWVDRVSRLRFGGGILRELIGAMAVYQDKRIVVILTIGMSVLVHIGLISSLYCIALALSSGSWPARLHFVVTPIGLAINAIPVTPGGIGVGEAGMQWLFEQVGQSGAVAFGAMLTFRAMAWIIAVAGVPYFVATFSETRKAIAESRQEAAESPVST